MKILSYSLFSALLIPNHCFAPLPKGVLEAESEHSQPITETLHLLDEKGHLPISCEFPQETCSEAKKLQTFTSSDHERGQQQKGVSNLHCPDHDTEVPPLKKSTFESLPRAVRTLNRMIHFCYLYESLTYHVVLNFLTKDFEKSTRTKREQNPAEHHNPKSTCSKEENVALDSTSRPLKPAKSETETEKDTLMPLFQVGEFNIPTAPANIAPTVPTTRGPVPSQISTNASEHISSFPQHTTPSESLHEYKPHGYNFPAHDSATMEYFQPQPYAWPYYPIYPKAAYIGSSNTPHVNIPVFENAHWNLQPIYGSHQPGSLLHSPLSGSYAQHFPPSITPPNQYFFQYGYPTQYMVGTLVYAVPVSMPSFTYEWNGSGYLLNTCYPSPMDPHFACIPQAPLENTLQGENEFNFYPPSGSEALRPVQYPGATNLHLDKGSKLESISAIKRSERPRRPESQFEPNSNKMEPDNRHMTSTSSKSGKGKQPQLQTESNSVTHNLESLKIDKMTSETKNHHNMDLLESGFKGETLNKSNEEADYSARKDLDSEYNEWLDSEANKKVTPKGLFASKLVQKMAQNPSEPIHTREDSLQIYNTTPQKISNFNLNSAHEFPPLRSSFGQQNQWSGKLNKGKNPILEYLSSEKTKCSTDKSCETNIEAKKPLTYNELSTLVGHGTPGIKISSKKTGSPSRYKEDSNKISDKYLFDSIHKSNKGSLSLESTSEKFHSKNPVNNSMKSLGVLQEIEDLESEATISQKTSKTGPSKASLSSISRIRDTGMNAQSIKNEHIANNDENMKIVVPSSIRSSNTKFNMRKKVKSKNIYPPVMPVENSLHQGSSTTLLDAFQKLSMTGPHTNKFVQWIYTMISQVGKVIGHQIWNAPHKLVEVAGEIATQATEIGLRYTKEYDDEPSKDFNEQEGFHHLDSKNASQLIENQSQQRKKKRKTFKALIANPLSKDNQDNLRGTANLAQTVDKNFHQEEGMKPELMELLCGLYQTHNETEFCSMDLTLSLHEKLKAFSDFRWESIPSHIIHHSNLPKNEVQRRTQVLAHQQSQFMIDESWKDYHPHLDAQVVQWLCLIFQVESPWPTFSHLNESFEICVKKELSSIPQIGEKFDTLKMVLGKELDTRNELIHYMISRGSKPIWWDVSEMSEARRQGIYVMDLIRLGDALCFDNPQAFKKTLLVLDESKLNRQRDPQKYPVYGCDWEDSPEKNWLRSKPKLWKIYQSNLKELILATDKACLYLHPGLLNHIGISSERTWWSGGDLLIWSDSSAPVILMNKIGESLNLKNFKDLKFDMIPIIKKKITNHGIDSKTRKRMMLCFERRCELNLELEERNKGLIWKIKDHIFSAWS
ncbi:uncharacterized protein MELLADRAFT_65227 [Melampsora larici-populina 98AG31]|uniref:Uncharacterized protein n=1 Tax=Melampsora larici-populina (strain 98AG31 / pathotype 3-4-7) TaxID=747676 RepID=F4RUH5_MELLP|nr:uncharacterized protein MELLADRAFT_65227 [Melampsora larici-populina 98AG31]EGG03936.1 hypothetical protein MELLADRAFT_65227 [Melampsora larici-populina 98AG31]